MHSRPMIDLISQLKSSQDNTKPIEQQKRKTATTLKGANAFVSDSTSNIVKGKPQLGLSSQPRR